ncbi:MAG: ABC transporter permease [Acidimicrobiales bacterium]|nr:ABC transporter permease [Acidimicrobiales bacterium]MCB1038043.1 ABC transporter permease [Acidimicrobiales bacterium]
MGYFLVRRTLQLLLVLWGGATILFFLFYVLPGNPAELIASGHGGRNPNPQVVANLEKRLGTDKPIMQQYVSYMKGVATGDLGESYRTREPVIDIAKRVAPHSFRLAFWAILIESVVGIGSGMLSARKRNSIGDYVTTIAAVVMSAIPVFVLAYLIKQVTGVYAYKHGWPAWATFPTIGYGDDTWVLGVIPTGTTWKYLVQPAIVLASVSTAIIARITRTSMLETMRMDHVRTARAKGLGEKQVMRRHVLRNALIPVVTVLGIDFGTMVGVAVLTETVFNLPGLGSQIVRSAKDYDLPVVLGLTIIVTAIYGLASLAVDISYAYLNPRVRLGDLDA